MTDHMTARTAGADASAYPGSVVRRRLSVVLAVRGVLAIAFGILALVWPGVTLLALALLFAAYTLVDGVGMIAGGLGAERDRGRRWAYVLAGALGIVAGLLAALLPGLTVLLLVVLAGCWALVTGVLEIAAAVRLRHHPATAWPTGLVGLVSVVAGVVVLVLPGVGALALATVLGTYALVAGVGLLVAAWRTRRGELVVAP